MPDSRRCCGNPPPAPCRFQSFGPYVPPASILEEQGECRTSTSVLIFASLSALSIRASRTLVSFQVPQPIVKSIGLGIDLLLKKLDVCRHPGRDRVQRFTSLNPAPTTSFGA